MLVDRRHLSRLRLDLPTAMVVAVAVAALVGRFIGLGVSPPGFYVDEAIAGSVLVCLKYTGADATGEALSAIASVSFGGAEAFYSPLWVYPGVLWTVVFGDSPSALRGFEAALSVVGVVATAAVARNFLGARAAAWVLLLGAISPWSWTLGRVAFGNSAVTGVALTMTGLWLVSRGAFRRPLRWFEAGGGALFLGSAAVVNHTRLVAVALVVLVAVVAVRRHLLDRAAVLGGAIGALLAALPVVLAGGRVDLWSRASGTWVLSDPDIPAAGLGRLAGIVGAVAANAVQHLTPGFLFFTGDSNLRHSTQLVGQLGWVEVLLIAGTPVAILLVRRRVVTMEVPRVYLAVAGVGGLSALLSVSFTSEALPHALRLFPAQPFIALGLGLVGVVLSERWHLMPVAAVALSLLFAAYFAPRYFTDYPLAAAGSFDTEVVAAAARARAGGTEQDYLDAQPTSVTRVAATYFMAAGSGTTCPGVLE